MDVVFDLLVLACGVVGALAVARLLLPMSGAATRAWLSGSGVEADDATVAAVRGASTRMAYTGAVVLVLLTAVLLGGLLKAFAPALALPVAVAASALVPVGGGSRRRAALEAPTAVPAPTRALALWSAVAVVVAAALWWLGGRDGGIVHAGSSVLPENERWSQPLWAACALLLAALGWVGAHRVRRRASLAAAPSAADRALRALSVRRLVAGVGGAQLVLAATALRLLPLATDDLDPFAAHPVGVLALALVAVALAWQVLALRPRVRETAAAPAQAELVPGR